MLCVEVADNLNKTTLILLFEKLRDDFREKRISLLELDCLLGIRNIRNIRCEGTETQSILKDCFDWVYLLLSVCDDLLDYEVKVSEFVQPESHQGGIHIVFLAN